VDVGTPSTFGGQWSAAYGPIPPAHIQHHMNVCGTADCLQSMVALHTVSTPRSAVNALPPGSVHTLLRGSRVTGGASALSPHPALLEASAVDVAGGRGAECVRCCSMPVNSGSRAITQSMLLYQTTLMVMLLLDSPLHVLGLSLEDTLEYQSCLINGCDDLCATRPLFLSLSLWIEGRHAAMVTRCFD
jgi:hypothetical protein